MLLVGCDGTIRSATPTIIRDAGAQSYVDGAPPLYVDGSIVLAPTTAIRSGARRLSRAELDETLESLLGDSTNPATRYLAEDEYAPYDNDYPRQTASRALVESLEALAEDVADRATSDIDVRSRLVPCVPDGEADERCFTEFLASFLPRAFRRPIAPSELDDYRPLLAFATDASPDIDTDFFTAVNLALRAVLQDPEFLYRVEIGSTGSEPGVLELNDHEIATRIAYFLWGTTPDSTLLDQAEAGELRTAEGRRRAATRMLDDPRALDQLRRFHAMWLGYRSIPHPADLAMAFDTETSALIERVVFEEDRDYLDLFTLDQTYLDTDLANHYGLPAPENGEGWITYPADSQRGGILSHGSVLAAFSKFTDTSPTQRGILVRSRLLCAEVAPAPPTVDVDKPPGGDSDAVCKSDRYALHRDQSSSCAGCHALIDPIGFGLERFDIGGRYRTHDDGADECTIEGTGALPGVGEFRGPGELGRLLVQSGALESCFVRQLFQFSIGRAPSDEDAAILDELVNQFHAGDRSLRSFLSSWVSSPLFAQRGEG